MVHLRIVQTHIFFYGMNKINWRVIIRHGQNASERAREMSGAFGIEYDARPIKCVNDIVLGPLGSSVCVLVTLFNSNARGLNVPRLWNDRLWLVIHGLLFHYRRYIRLVHTFIGQYLPFLYLVRSYSRETKKKVTKQLDVKNMRSKEMIYVRGMAEAKHCRWK